jgi:hypothetical protein
LVEQLIRNQQVIGSSPIAGSKLFLRRQEITVSFFCWFHAAACIAALGWTNGETPY